MSAEHSEQHIQAGGVSKLGGSNMLPIGQTRVTTVNLGSPLFRKEGGPYNVSALLKNAIDISLDDDVTVSTSASTAFSSDKRVHFDTSQNEEFAANEEHFLTEEICEQAWYSEEDRWSMKCDREIDLDESNEQEKDNWTDGLKQLVKFVTHAPVHYNFTAQDLLDKAKPVSTCDLRGLETEVVPALTALRKKHANNVLTYTERVPKRLPQDLRDRMISTRSLQHSRPHLLFAQAMAQVDRNAVLEMK